MTQPADRRVDPTKVPTAVRERMQRVRRSGTKPERAVATLLRSLGVRYRCQVRSLPGTPDFSNQRAGWAILVHGCFWHGHDCALYRLPKTNAEFWLSKVESNRERDRRKEAELRARGLRVFTIWQCKLSEPDRLRAQLAEFLGIP